MYYDNTLHIATIKEFSAKEKRSKDDDPSRQKICGPCQLCFNKTPGHGENYHS